MLKKPNRNQAVYIATLIATFAVGVFTWSALPALDKVMSSVGLPGTMYAFMAASFVTLVLLSLGYLILSDNASRKD